MTVGWALLGTGRHAVKNVLPQMKQAAGTQLVAVVSRDHARAENFAREHGFAQGYTSLAEALRDPQVQALYHATPDGLHARDAIEGAKAGRHSLIEKPLAITLAQCQEVIQACRMHGVKLGVVFQQRHEAVHLEARRMVRAGEIGEVMMARAQLALRVMPPPAAAPALSTWRNDPAMRPGGIVMGIGDHAYDTLAWILGQEITEVMAMTDATRADAPNERVGSLLLKFSKGAVGVAAASSRTPFAQRPIEIHGTSGSLILNNTYAYLTGASEDPRPSMEIRAGAGGSVRYFPVSEAFRLEIEHFNRCVEGAGAPMTPGEDGLRAHAVTEAAYESQQSGRVQQVAKFATRRVTP
ncbi:MAG: hypothetical protein A3H35_04490 [Betaproteobacteria bacterium RIFCSPLOWO2_02_FULL_62_17]|nr:MAG: hypothetical protein A3H35_04490 [Betaproteobacteria bacterium RIFCSPLOWO2_02_FULL_62_17]